MSKSFLPKMILWTTLALLGFFLVHLFGGVAFMLEHDRGVSLSIVGLHVAFTLLILRRAWLLSRTPAEHAQHKRASRYFATMATITVTATLIGNALGFVQSFTGINPADLADASKAPAILGQVLAGPAMALVATIVGVTLWVVQVVYITMLNTALEEAAHAG